MESLDKSSISNKPNINYKNKSPLLKILLTGESKVGKSTIIYTFKVNY
jgi:GTPase SAR1 family protein